VALVRLSGIWEVTARVVPLLFIVAHDTSTQHYNPLTGQPYGAKDVGMSTLVCDWIQRKRAVQ
jgi:hypothetical protein